MGRRGKTLIVPKWCSEEKLWVEKTERQYRKALGDNSQNTYLKFLIFYYFIILLDWKYSPNIRFLNTKSKLNHLYGFICNYYSVFLQVIFVNVSWLRRANDSDVGFNKILYFSKLLPCSWFISPLWPWVCKEFHIIPGFCFSFHIRPT